MDKSWRKFDLERGSDYQAVADDSDLFLSLHPERIAIDGAQIHPALFPALRVAIDENRQSMGRFIVTGSSSPELTHSITESLAGRVGIIEMSPLGYSEIFPTDKPGLVDLLLDNKNSARDLVAKGSARSSLKELSDYWYRGGYPEPWLKNDDRFSELWMDQYVKTYVLRDIARLFPGLNQEKFRIFARMLGGLSGRVVNQAEVDLILEGKFGLVAVEIKLGQRVRLASLRGLGDFVKDQGCRFGIVLSNEDQGRMITENIVGLPVRFL